MKVVIQELGLPAVTFGVIEMTLVDCDTIAVLIAGRSCKPTLSPFDDPFRKG